jgi:hypothetical protein
MASAAVKSNIASENSPPLSAHRRLMSRKLAGINAGQFPKVSYACMQCFAKCPFTRQVDRLSGQLCQSLDRLIDQLCQSLDRLSDHFAKHCMHAHKREVVQNLAAASTDLIR